MLGLAEAVPAPVQAQRAAQRAAPPAAVVFDGVTVVDVERGQLVPAQRVVIVGHRIQAVGAADAVKTPKGAQVVAAQGKYLIPGLWDMHVHTSSGRGENGYDVLDHYAAFLTAGVTGVRDMGSEAAPPPKIVHQWRRQVAARTRVGPRVLVGGRPRPAEMPETAAQGRRAIDSLKALGVDFVKAHTWGSVSRDAYFAMIAEARRVGLVFTGHHPYNVTMAEASDSGVRSMEHWDYFSGPCWQADSAGEAQCRELAARLARNGTWLTPTLRYYSWRDTMPAGWYEHYVPDTTRVENILHPSQNATREMASLWFVHRAQRVGGFPWLAGTDINLWYGMGSNNVGNVHRELAKFVDAGLTPAEALRTATLNPAKYLNGTDSLGTIAPGKLADLVLLDADPLADITNTRTIRAVVANGRYFDRAAFDEILSKAKSPYKSDGLFKNP